MEDDNVPKINKIFSSSIGTVMGIVVGGFGGGAMVFNQIQTKIVNPDNVKVMTKAAFLLDLKKREVKIDGQIRFEFMRQKQIKNHRYLYKQIQVNVK